MEKWDQSIEDKNILEINVMVNSPEQVSGHCVWVTHFFYRFCFVTCLRTGLFAVFSKKKIRIKIHSCKVFDAPYSKM